MRQGWRGRGYYNRGRRANNSDNRSTNNASCSGASKSVPSTAGSVRAPANQAPIIVSLSANITNTWKLYFPTHDNSPDSDASQHIKVFKEYINKYRNRFDLEKIDVTRSVPLDVQLLLQDDEFKHGWPTFENSLSEKPEYTLRLLEYCLHESLNCEYKIKVRILNHQLSVPLHNLKVNYFGKLVTIKGIVIRVGSVGLLCTSMAFECCSCHNILAVQQPKGAFTAPNHCTHCRSGAKFEPLQSSPFTTTTDWQVAKVQEMHTQGISGTIPRSVEVDLEGDMVGTACPGDVLTVTGIVQVRSESKGGEDGKRAARLLQLYIEAVSIHSERSLSHTSMPFTIKDYYAIQEIHASEDVFRLLVHSLCPSIYGQEAVKAGLILGLMGGTELDSGPRCNPHVLVVGDPGLGKSRLLQAAASAAPRGVYVCGASASGSGLTVSLGREAGGEFALEAGALVLADRGVCCVDELDKMTAHHSSLLEAMEQCRVSVAKGGVVCSLAARATVLAAANPAAGIYNRAKTVAENLKMNSALLSRFDLVFILLDKPNEAMSLPLVTTFTFSIAISYLDKSDYSEWFSILNAELLRVVLLSLSGKGETDELLSEHVLSLHSGKKKSNTAHNLLDNTITSQSDKDISLRQRLKLKRGETIDTLPTVLLRKYISYARRYVHPKLSNDAANALQSFYMELRHNHQGDSTPITTRQLEACIRLTQARARAELREEATESDAKDVISLMKHSLIDTFSDEYGQIQLSRSINGSGVSCRGKLKKFLNVLSTTSHQLGKDVFTRQELIKLHKDAGITGDASDLIESMHIHCFLLLKGHNTYQLITM